MRTLELNKSKLWYVNPNEVDEIEVVDEDGYYTGEVIKVYGVPKVIKLHLYPATGDVVEREFGMNIDVDMVTTTKIDLEKDTLLFIVEPTEKFNTTYNYMITHKLPSLNSFQYGLKGRR